MNRNYILENFLKNEDKLEARNKEGIEKYRKGNFKLYFFTYNVFVFTGERTISKQP